MRGPDTSDGSCPPPQGFPQRLPQLPQRLTQRPQNFPQLPQNLHQKLPQFTQNLQQKLPQISENLQQKLPQLSENVTRRSSAWKQQLSRFGQRMQRTLNGNSTPTKLQQEWSTQNQCNLQQTVASTRFLDGNYSRQSVRYPK